MSFDPEKHLYKEGQRTFFYVKTRDGYAKLNFDRETKTQIVGSYLSLSKMRVELRFVKQTLRQVGGGHGDGIIDYAEYRFHVNRIRRDKIARIDKQLGDLEVTAEDLRKQRMALEKSLLPEEKNDA